MNNCACGRPAIAKGLCKSCYYKAQYHSGAARRLQLNAARRARRAKDPERAREDDRKANAKKTSVQRRASNLKRYGLTPEAFDALCRGQNGRCAICEQCPDHVLYVDHCHMTGAVRGLLCRKCNFAIGLLEDSTSRLDAAKVYLGRHV